MHHKKSFPVWLLCLLLFAGFLFLAVKLIPPFLAKNTSVQAAVSATESTVPASSPEAELPETEQTDPETADEPVNEQSVTAEEAEIVAEEPEAVPGEDSEPETQDTPPSDGNELVPVSDYGVPEWGHIHRYHDGVCTVCGEAPEFYTGFLPHEFYAETENAGTVELHKYEITAYPLGYGTYNKCFNVYLPYGYDDSKPYNVLVLVHGGGGDQNSWLNDTYKYKNEGIEMCGRVILDNMFEKGICDPCIVVCPVTEIPQCQGLTASTTQLQQELREYILPYIAEHYSTYAADGTLESLKDARDHFALGGLSNGALFVYEGGMRYDFDLFGSYAAFSGNGEPWVTVTTIKHTKAAFSKLGMNCYFTGAGTENDWQQNYTKIGYDYFLEHLDYLTEGKNAWRVDVEGGHEWKVWFTDLFNALPLMFPS